MLETLLALLIILCVVIILIPFVSYLALLLTSECLDLLNEIKYKIKSE